jgi:transcription-repair coupling factor (superfamily II helicase)
VAVISPLLVLAEEHSETFIERMAPFGVRVAVLTRMQSPGEARTILSGLKNGKIDIVIGTHRLLSDDIHFRRLGLLIIDEEHRFGVEHKERFKKLKSHIDVLMLSATPIPRSLNLALSGLKTISMLTTAPYMRKSIRTIVTAWNESTILQAIHYELAR